VIRRRGHLGHGFLVFLGTLAAPTLAQPSERPGAACYRKDSDLDVPILKEAKAEYEKLK
jgi:hypothetical protein